jgi:uncharacterized membrane protein YccF (DUF307 family)
MSLLKSSIWFIFGGFILGACYILLGLCFCVTIVGWDLGWKVIKSGYTVMVCADAEVAFDEKATNLFSEDARITLALTGNIIHLIWLCLVGLIGVCACLTFVGIPVGRLMIQYCNKRLEETSNMTAEKSSGDFCGTVVWILLFGWTLALTHLCFACLFCLFTPFARQHFKLTLLALFPLFVTVKFPGEFQGDSFTLELD